MYYRLFDNNDEDDVIEQDNVSDVHNVIYYIIHRQQTQGNTTLYDPLNITHMCNFNTSRYVDTLDIHLIF